MLRKKEQEMTFEELKKVVEEDSLKFIPTKNNKTFISVKEIEKANQYFDKVNQKEFNENTIKEVLGRQWKHCLKSLTPLMVFLSKQSRKRPTEISCYLFKDINADQTRLNIGKLIKLDIIRCIQKHYSKDASLARIYQVNWFRFDLFYLMLGRSDEMREIEEFDRSNSIYKVNDYVMNRRIRDNDRSKYDLYLKICKKPELRESVKVLVMTLYFSDARKFRSLCTNYFAYYMKRVTIDGARIIAQKGKDRVEAVINILGLKGEINIDQTIDKMVEWYKNTRELLKKEIGEFVGRSIFLYEAIVNLSTEIALLEKGYFCVSVYDGFYTNAREEEWWDCYCSSLKILNNLEGDK